jgi:hypothetical protein
MIPSTISPLVPLTASPVVIPFILLALKAIIFYTCLNIFLLLMFLDFNIWQLLSISSDSLLFSISLQSLSSMTAPIASLYFPVTWFLLALFRLLHWSYSA